MDAAKRSAEAGDERLAEIVSERTLAAQLTHLDYDRLGFRLPDPDGEEALAFLLPQNHYVGIVRPIEPEAHDLTFDELHCRNVMLGTSGMKTR